MAGVSTRKYGRVIGEMADTVGVSKSAVSRETVEASERVLKELMERRLDAWDLLVIYLDGIRMGSHHVLAAVGVDSDGKKHVLGVREGASENAEVTSALLEDLVERGLDPGRRRLFVIDGSKALRKAIEKVFGQRHPIQRCRNHKLRNVLGHLPKDQHPQVKAAFRAAMKLDAKQGEQKLEQLARWLERDHPSASASLREGLSEMFTINRLGLPPRLRKCLGSTNLIDSTHSGVRQKTRRVTNWKHLRTTNVVESPFAAVRLRTTAAKRFKRVESATALIWKLLLVAEKRFRRLDAPHLLKDVFEGRKFEDGKPVSTQQRKNAA